MIERFREDAIADAVALGEMMHRESEFRRIPYSPMRAAEIARRCVEDDAWFGVFDRTKSGRVGMFIGSLQRFYFSEENGAFDLLWYVRPDARGGTSGVRLLDSFIGWAKDKGVREVRLGVSTGVEVEKTDRVLRRLGFAHVGGSYCLRVR